MEKTEIFPAEFMSMTTEYHFHKYNPQTNIIYRLVLGIVILAIVSLFFIKINISVKSAGVITSTTGHDDIKSLVSANVDKVFLKENMHVKKGQVLVVLKAGAISQQDALAQAQQSQLQAQLSDLQQLSKMATNKSWHSRPQLKSELYSQQYAEFLQRVREASATAQVARRSYSRYAYLYNHHAISAAEFDVVQLQYKNASNALQLIYDEQGSRWQAAYSDMQIRYRGVQSEGESLKEQKDYYTLRAPVDGTVQNVKGIQPGSAVTANDVLAQISPETGLIAEAYVQPRDVGFLKPAVKANFMVDAFDYREWGKLTGKIISVSNDVFIAAGQQPYFKVRCKLDNNELKLRNGYTGHLKKGMTIQANFFVTRRTLFQLLYDRVDNWLNPGKIATHDDSAQTS